MEGTHGETIDQIETVNDGCEDDDRSVSSTDTSSIRSSNTSCPPTPSSIATSLDAEETDDLIPDLTDNFDSFPLDPTSGPAYSSNTYPDDQTTDREFPAVKIVLDGELSSSLAQTQFSSSRILYSKGPHPPSPASLREDSSSELVVRRTSDASDFLPSSEHPIWSNSSSDLLSIQTTVVEA
ncbi:hypothetical protein M231_04855 [Tremella mesenterica]|uniref:Uncharacterized protein n=1 Tax=Tremella mesenterica TaxID=5217 RepID=A0A4V1M3S2_TREME|nr:uncharacterized protein TREMEDRAFT_66232 [Tremella mesenterica DSM 1558]EIW65864.1 hypothetical protein TREMEDRAFT_66232 [Tremella mesenterica DSM 1558]RXK37857.1 hypothetical protein M231_04855 [Tremella mesenterica]